jgi:hypothetical protein
VLPVEIGQRRDPGERVLEGVDADVAVPQAQDELFASGPAHDLGVAEGAAVHHEGHAGVRVVRQVQAERQALAHVAVVGLRVRGAGGEAEPLGELLRACSEQLRVHLEERQEQGVRQAGAVRVADSGA